jgi:exosortase family protein XrtF
MFKRLPSALFRFFTTAFILYASLFLFYQFLIKKYSSYDQQFIGHIIYSAEKILHLVGYSTFKVLQDLDLQVIGIDGSNGVWIGSECNAIKLFCLFSVFIIAYPGPRKHKLWYVPLGILSIHLLNILRVVALTIIAKESPHLLDFNHSYVFTFLIYAFIFSLWMIWVNKLAPEMKNE